MFTYTEFITHFVQTHSNQPNDQRTAVYGSRTGLDNMTGTDIALVGKRIQVRPPPAHSTGRTVQAAGTTDGKICKGNI
jgi:hypothetical protein